MILADTSAWVEYDRATGSAIDRRIATLIDTDGELVTTEPVIMELTAGARDAAAADTLRRLLLRGGLLPFDAAIDFEAAGTVYRTCRRAGFTPWGLVDCMIAAVALRYGASILCRDVDLTRICTTLGIDLDTA